MKLLPIVFAIPIAMLLLACGGTANNQDTMPTTTPATEPGDSGKTVTDKDNGGRITIEMNRQLRVLLPSRRGTGARWQLANKDLKILKPRDGDPKVVQGTGTPGGREMVEFVLDATNPGTEELKLVEIARPNMPPSNTFTITVEVKP